ncbi:MAG: SLOG family protein [Clostridia bacterium]
MEKEITCCFTGHRDMDARTGKAVQKELEKNLCRLIGDGFTCFESGGARGFDLLAANTVIRLKKKHPQIRLSMILPCRDQDRFWNKKQRDEYRAVLAAADEVIYTADAYYKGCMMKRNRYLVDSATCVLAYLERDAGGTKYTVDYANKTGVEVLFVQPPQKHHFSLLS